MIERLSKLYRYLASIRIVCRCFWNEWYPGTWLEMCCLNTQQCPLPRWKVETSGCAPLGKLWEVSIECLGQTSRLRSCWGRARWPQSRATVTLLPWAMGSCGHLSTCAYPCLWQRATLIGEKTTRAGKRAEMPTEVSREKHPGQSTKTVLIGPLAVRSCPVTLSPLPCLPWTLFFAS